MAEDARFEDGDDGPLALLAQRAADVPVMSSLLQDGVIAGADLSYDARRRRFAALINRFRWEDHAAAQAAGRPFERVRSLFVAEDVLSVRSTGFARGEGVLALLSLEWVPGVDGTGQLRLILSGGGVIEASCEALDLRLRDVTRPHIAPSRRAPDHGAD